jgi:broad specificity phosphatase PhoE
VRIKKREGVLSAEMKFFLVRHATPDWNRTDIPYDIPPGPLLSSKGEKEAEELAVFLKSQLVARLYYSPFERTTRTAKIVSAINGIPCVEEARLAEWRGQQEGEPQVRMRMKAAFEGAILEAAETGPIGLVSHGGPIGALLQELGIDPGELAEYKTRFDTTNPLPPAGAWQVEWNEKNHFWNLDLKFVPSVS